VTLSTYTKHTPTTDNKKPAEAGLLESGNNGLFFCWQIGYEQSSSDCHRFNQNRIGLTIPQSTVRAAVQFNKVYPPSGLRALYQLARDGVLTLFISAYDEKRNLLARWLCCYRSHISPR
jgi:hypothetical protein